MSPFLVRLGYPLSILWLAGTLVACAQPEPGSKYAASGPAPLSQLDKASLLDDVRFLSSDSLEGRLTGTRGNRIARDFIARRFADLQLTPSDSGFIHPFSLKQRDGQILEAGNVLAVLQGTDTLSPVLALTAHFDHIGVRNGKVYNGADDNASGIGALLALAAYFAKYPLRHSLLFAALDAEEMGLHGAQALLGDATIDTSTIRLNVNLDMLGRSDRGELYVAGTYHSPSLAPLLARVADSAPVTLVPGHDRPDVPGQADWTSQSDHFAFHRARIPFLYFGVEDHADSHGPNDDFERLQPDFLFGAAETVRRVLVELDSLPGTARP